MNTVNVPEQMVVGVNWDHLTDSSVWYVGKPVKRHTPYPFKETKPKDNLQRVIDAEVRRLK